MQKFKIRAFGEAGKVLAIYARSLRKERLQIHTDPILDISGGRPKRIGTSLSVEDDFLLISIRHHLEHKHFKFDTDFTIT